MARAFDPGFRLPQSVKPMRGAPYESFFAIRNMYPFFVQPKVDGIRGLVYNGVAFSRSGKPLPNADLQKWFAGKPGLNGCDLEITVGEPNRPRVYRETNSAVMADFGDANWVVTVFDLWAMTQTPYYERFNVLTAGLKTDHQIRSIECRLVELPEQLQEYEQLCLENSWEGVMLRKPSSIYKYGKSTLREGHLIKVKRYMDAEARITGYEPLYTHEGESFRDDFGYERRDAKKENLVEQPMLGALIGETVGDGFPKEGVSFKCGSGFDDAEREYLWSIRESLPGQHFTYKHQGVGDYDAPRQPIFKDLRKDHI